MERLHRFRGHEADRAAAESITSGSDPQEQPSSVLFTRAVQVMLRVSLAASFLSAVADRFGLWGPPDTPGVAWGSWEGFVECVSLLSWFAPASAIPVLAWGATSAEITLATALLFGWRLRYVAFASGLLLCTFALAMASALGFKAPLDYSVFSAAAGAFLLAAVCTRHELPG